MVVYLEPGHQQPQWRFVCLSSTEQTPYGVKPHRWLITCKGFSGDQYSDIAWAPQHLISLATQLFVEYLIQADNKTNMKALHYWPICEGNPLVTSGFPSQRDSNAGSISMSRHRYSMVRSHTESNNIHRVFCEFSLHIPTPCCSIWCQFTTLAVPIL